MTALDPKSGQPIATGKLTFISNAVDMSTGTITLKGTFPNEDRALWPGAFVDVELRLVVEKGVTVAPSSAVTVGQRGQQVFVVKPDGSAELRTVSVKRTVGQESVIEGGVAPGEKVVTNGQLRLFPGAKVQPKPATNETTTSATPTKSAATSAEQHTGREGSGA